MKRFDVHIVGAVPADSSPAIFLCHKGYSVILLDSRVSPLKLVVHFAWRIERKRFSC